MKYDRKNVLSLKLRGKVSLRRLTRAEFFTRLQVLRTIDPIAKRAYQQREDALLRSQEEEAPHGNPWHVSFHASQFPGDDPMACPRQALYRMMDFSRPDAIPRKVRVAGVIGKSVEIDIVDAFHRAGILLSAPPDAEMQTGFEIADAWLTGSVDSVIQKFDNKKPIPVEIKSAYRDKIEKMKVSKLGPDEAHVKQTKVQIALVRLAQQEDVLWGDRELCDHGFIYYFSRDDPSQTVEFRVDYDDKFFTVGIERLKQWKGMFLEDMLPEGEASKKHPMGWRWTYPPCQFCPFKKTCKLDFEQGIESLSDSVGVNRTRLVRPDYDPQAARQRVLDRWADREDSGKITHSVPKRDREGENQRAPLWTPGGTGK